MSTLITFVQPGPALANSTNVPSVTTTGATQVTSGTVMLNGSINPRGLTTTYDFQWSTSPTSFSNTTPAKTLSASYSRSYVSAQLTGLNAGTTYYFRLVASNGRGTVYGARLYSTTHNAAPPAAPVLSGTAGDSQATLTWSAATDANGIAKYEVWRNNAYVQTLPGSALTYTDTGVTDGTSYTYRVVAYDPTGNYTNSTNVTLTPSAAPTGGGSPSTPAPFPSRLRASGRNLVDENGYVMQNLKGFNVQVVPWSQADFNAMAAVGGKIVRTVVFWDSFEPTHGTISSSMITNLDMHIARLQAAGMYTSLDFHLNVPSHMPTWLPSGILPMNAYMTYGQTLTQYLANRYGNPASPHYTKAVIGFGLNEPPPDSTTNSIPTLESEQRTMLTWVRASGYAPSWIGFVGMGYASASPTYSGALGQDTSSTNADPHAYDSVGGNVVLDVHDYSMGSTNTNPADDGRQFNGMIYPTWQGGQAVGTGDASYPAYPPYTTEAITKSQMAAFIYPYKQFSIKANIPIMIGEWGWSTANTTGYASYIADKMAIWADAGAVIEMQWDYNVTPSQDPFAARPNGTWQPVTVAWMTG